MSGIDKIFYGPDAASSPLPAAQMISLSVDELNFLLQVMVASFAEAEGKLGPIEEAKGDLVLLRPEWEGWAPLLQALDADPDGPSKLLAEKIRGQLTA